MSVTADNLNKALDDAILAFAETQQYVIENDGYIGNEHMEDVVTLANRIIDLARTIQHEL